MYDTILNYSFNIMTQNTANVHHHQSKNFWTFEDLCQIRATYVSHIHGILFYMFMWETPENGPAFQEKLRK